MAQDTDTSQRLVLPKREPFWSIGLRLQAFKDLVVEAALDATVYPWKHLGLGITAATGVGMGASGCEGAPSDSCGSYWKAVRPFAELRAMPASWFSPYARAGLGLAYGDFTFWKDHPGSIAFAPQLEAGVAMHHLIGVRLFFASHWFEGATVSQHGNGLGLQLGATF